MSSAGCQASLNYKGETRYLCSEADNDDLYLVTLICVHEHLFDATLCEAHRDTVEQIGKCPWCGSTEVSGELRHVCKVRIHESALVPA